MAKPPEIIIEMIPQGKFVKVTAIDVTTGREVSIVGASSANQNDLRRLAINKLNYVMAREKREREENNSAAKGKRGFEI